MRFLNGLLSLLLISFISFLILLSLFLRFNLDFILSCFSVSKWVFILLLFSSFLFELSKILLVVIKLWGELGESFLLLIVFISNKLDLIFWTLFLLFIIIFWFELFLGYGILNGTIFDFIFWLLVFKLVSDLLSAFINLFWIGLFSSDSIIISLLYISLVLISELIESFSISKKLKSFLFFILNLPILPFLLLLFSSSGFFSLFNIKYLLTFSYIFFIIEISFIFFALLLSNLFLAISISNKNRNWIIKFFRSFFSNLILNDKKISSWNILNNLSISSSLLFLRNISKIL